MAYTVLARRYRSATFDEVVGQDHVSGTLKRAIESGRVAHAYLFCGTRGVGKTSMARILAKALNCESSAAPTVAPCGACATCSAIARGDDIDVIEIDAASNRGIDEVRRLIENARFSPARSRFKVYIIDEVHAMTREAFNALLKTLEEPPQHVKFILATTEPEKVLPTILSRCQRYDFRAVSTRSVAAHLRAICDAEKVRADEDALLLVARAGAGSIRDSLSLLDRLLSMGQTTLDVASVEQLLGLPRAQLVFDLVEAIGSGAAGDALRQADAMVRAGFAPDALLAALIEHLRNLLVLRACGDAGDLVETPGLPEGEVARQAARFEPATLSQDIVILESLRRQLRTSQAGRALLDATMARLALAEQFGAAAPAGGEKKNAEPAPRIDLDLSPLARSGARPLPSAAEPAPPIVRSNVKPPAASAPAAPLALQVASPADPSATERPPRDDVEAVEASDLPGVWRRLLEELSRDGPSLPPLLAGARLDGIEADEVVVRMPHEQGTMARLLERNGKKETIRDALARLLDRAVHLRIELDAPLPETPAPEAPEARREPRPPPPTSPEPPEPAATPITPELIRQLRSDNPVIDLLCGELGGKIVRVD